MCHSCSGSTNEIYHSMVSKLQYLVRVWIRNLPHNNAESEEQACRPPESRYSFPRMFVLHARTVNPDDVKLVNDIIKANRKCQRTVRLVRSIREICSGVASIHRSGRKISASLPYTSRFRLLVVSQLLTHKLCGAYAAIQGFIPTMVPSGR